MADLGVLLCAVTDVTPINFKGPHFKSTPPPLTLLNPTFLFLCCCLSAGSMGSQLYVDLAKCALRFVYSLPPPLLHPSSRAACPLTAPDFVFWWKGPAQMSHAASSSCSWTSPFFSTKEERGPRSRCTFVWGPSCRFLLFVSIDGGVDVLAVAFFFFLFCQSFVLVWVCSGWWCGTGTFSHLIFLLCSIQGYGPLLCHSNLASNLHYYINYGGFGLISVLKFCHVVCKAKCIHSNLPCWTSSSWARPSRASTLNGETDPCFGNSWQRFSSLSPLYLNKLQRWTKQIISLSSYLLINTLVTRKMKLSCKQMYFHWFLINL